MAFYVPRFKDIHQSVVAIQWTRKTCLWIIEAKFKNNVPIGMASYEKKKHLLDTSRAK